MGSSRRMSTARSRCLLAALSGRRPSLRRGHKGTTIAAARQGIARMPAQEEPAHVVSTRCSHHHRRRRCKPRHGLTGIRTRQGTARAPRHRGRASPHLACAHARASLARRRHRASAHPAAVLVLRAPGSHGRSRCRPRRHRAAVLGRLSQRIRDGGGEEMAASFCGDGPPAARRSEIEGPARHLEGSARHAGRPPHFQPFADRLAHRRHRRLVLAGRPPRPASP